MYILYEVTDGIAQIVLNRPSVLNAWHSPMRIELIDRLKQADAASDVGAVIVTGAGDRAFCTGLDFNEVKDWDGAHIEDHMAEWATLYTTMRQMKKPIVMALNGIAAGSGFQASLYGDVRVAHAGVRMGQVEIDIGLPGITGPWIMWQIMGLSRTVEMTLRGRLMDAAEAKRIGVVQSLVPQAAVMTEATRIASELAGKPRMAMSLTRQWFREMTEPEFHYVMDGSVEILRAAYASGEPGRLMKDFLNERARRKSLAERIHQ